MPHPQKSRRLLALAAVALVSGQLAAPRSAEAFSQSSPITPIGHEWITVSSALELLNQPKPTIAELAKDKGKGVISAVGSWLKEHLGLSAKMSKTKALEQQSMRKNFNASLAKALTASNPDDKFPRSGFGSYSAKYYNVWSAVMGQRWVDLGGFNVVKSSKCWDAITQAGEDQQADHFLRRRTHTGPGGAINAIEEARLHFRNYFIAAATADPEDKEVIVFKDGGAEVGRVKQARKAYFLFGRAAHLFQDSFSAEHGVRDANNGYKTILDIKSYVCTLASVGHTHNKPTSGNHGDVIFYHDFSLTGRDYSDTNLKPYAIAAILAMQDLWTAFLNVRTARANHDRTKLAGVFADALMKRWMSYDRSKVGHTLGQMTTLDQPACIKATSPAAAVVEEHAKCMALIGPASDSKDADSRLGIPFNWTWQKGGTEEN